MGVDAIGSSLSGVSSAFARRNATAHNVANLLTEDFRPLRARQFEVEAGGSRVEVERAAQPETLDLAREFVDSSLASVQAKASLRVLDTDLDLIGTLIDTLG
jgi:phage-related minor tail protein